MYVGTANGYQCDDERPCMLVGEISVFSSSPAFFVLVVLEDMVSTAALTSSEASTFPIDFFCRVGSRLLDDSVAGIPDSTEVSEFEADISSNDFDDSPR